MCFFPFKNTNIKSTAYKKGVIEFKCGCCPECLSDKSKYWALRCSAEAQTNLACMITLTYDDYKLDKYGRKTCEEKPVDNSLHVDKRDCQLFIKRLRKHFPGNEIKYLLTAEYGKRTHRAHYHAILFGVDFKDKIKYKRSKRGNLIYKSPTLEKIWGHGICTIDAVNVTGAVARYCTKYCAKDSRCDDTFMLFSHGIGDKWLLDNFNGISYMIDGREYTIPRGLWIKYLEDKWKNNVVFQYQVSGYHRYKSLKWLLEKLGDLGYQAYDFYTRKRKLFQAWLDRDKLRQNYLSYWRKKIELFNLTKKPVLDRVRALPNDKYFAYKQKALACLVKRSQLVDNYSTCYEYDNLELPPRYMSQTRKLRAEEKLRRKFAHLAPCHKCANDTFFKIPSRFIANEVPKSWFFKPSQLSFV